MNVRHLVRSIIHALAARLLMAILAVGPGLQAAHAQQENGEYLLSEPTYNALTEINDMLQNGRYEAALRELQILDDRVDDAYEQAVVDQTLGYAYNSLKRYDRAAAAFIRAVESGALPPDVSHRLEYFIAQLLAQNEDYARAITYLERWFRNESAPDLEAHRLAAALYYQARNYARVIEHARAAIRLSETADESLYQLLLAAYFETRNYAQAADLLRTLLRLFPDNREYWKQLASTYQLLNQETKAVAVMELANRRGLLTADEKLQLARLYLHLESPYQAARFLQREMDQGGLERNRETLQLLAESHFLARETDAAIEAYGEAAQRFGDAEFHIRRGQLLFNQQRWEEAYRALREALAAGQLENPAQAQLLLGIAAYKIERYDAAAQALNAAVQDSATRDSARYWLQQIEQLREQQDAGNDSKPVSPD